jgi:hypothetical protein
MVKHTPMMIEFDMYSKSNMYNRFKKLSSCLGLLQGTGKVGTPGGRVYRQDAICDMKNAKGELKSIYKRRTKI